MDNRGGYRFIYSAVFKIDLRIGGSLPMDCRLDQFLTPTFLNVHTLDREHSTPLHIPAMEGYGEVVQLLINAGRY